MVLTSDQQRVKSLLTETITLLCRNGLHFKSEFNIEGLIGITLDKETVFLVNINETFRVSGGIEGIEDSGKTVSDISATASSIKTTARKRQRSLEVHGERLGGNCGESKRQILNSNSETSDISRTQTSSSSIHDSIRSHQSVHRDYWSVAEKTHEKHLPEASGYQNSNIPNAAPSRHSGGDEYSENVETCILIKSLDNIYRMNESDGRVTDVDVKEEAEEIEEDEAGQYGSSEAGVQYGSSETGVQYGSSEAGVQYGGSEAGGQYGATEAWDINRIHGQPDSGFRSLSSSDLHNNKNLRNLAEADLPQDLPGRSLNLNQGEPFNEEGERVGGGEVKQETGHTSMNTLYQIPLKDLRAFNVNGRYVCPYCDRYFSASNNLRGHLAVHTGVREFKCPLCAQEFAYKHHLKAHLGKCVTSLQVPAACEPSLPA